MTNLKIHFTLKKLVVAFAIPFLIPGFSLNAQFAYKYKNYEEHNFNGLRYGLYKPDGYDPGKKYPLIVYLHGSRDTVSREMNWYQPASQKQHPCIVLTPKCEVSDQG